MCITALLINSLWKSVYKHDEKLKRMGWLPILIWITIPDCFWSYSNNMHENTMGIFILLSVLLTWKFLESNNENFISLILSGSCIFMATFSKGIPGLFPVTVPFLFWISTRRIRFSRAILYSTILLVIPLLIYAILICFNESRESLSIYLFKKSFTEDKL